GLHALQLCRRPDHQAGGRGGEIARPQEGGGADQIGPEVQDRDRRPVLRQEGRRDPPRLHRLHLEEGSQRQDHLQRDRVTISARPMGSPPRAEAGFFLTPQPMFCSTGKVSINQLFNCVNTPARKPMPVSTRRPPITRSTWARWARKRARKAANGSTASAAMMNGTPSPSE